MGSRQERQPGAEDEHAAAPRLYLTHKASLTVSSLRAAINTSAVPAVNVQVGAFASLACLHPLCPILEGCGS